MISPKNHVDIETNKLYGKIRSSFGQTSARANGYRFQKFFKIEQKILLSTIDPQAINIVDLGCGSGLGLIPLLTKKRNIIGIDFNVDACLAANSNGLNVVRGDVYTLPFANSVLDQVINCQFLNQQSKDKPGILFAEIARVLRSGGSATLIWRNGDSFLHQIAHRVFNLIDRMCLRPQFPQVTHSMDSICDEAMKSGLNIELNALSFPFIKYPTNNINGILGRFFGASYILKIRKSDH